MIRIILILALGFLCPGLKGQSIFTESCGDSLLCIVWDFPDDFQNNQPVGHINLSFEVDEGSVISSFYELDVDNCDFCEGEQGIDWYYTSSISGDAKVVEVDIYRTNDSLSVAGMMAGIIIIIDDAVGKKRNPLQLIQNPSRNLMLDYLMKSRVPVKVELIEIPSGRKHLFQSIPYQRKLPIQNILPGYYYISLPEVDSIGGTIWLKE